MARLVVTDGPDQGKEYLLDELGEGSHLAGRDPRHPIAISDTAVSREHFRVERLPRGFRLVDLGSRNRTFVNGEPVRESLLRNGDVIAVGDSELRYEDDAEEIEIAELASTILKEYSSLEGSSIGLIIDSLKNDPSARRGRIQHAVDNLRQLFDLSREMMRSASVDDLYNRFLEILVPALDADRGVVMTQSGDAWTPQAIYTAGVGHGESTRRAERRGTRSTTRTALAGPAAEPAGADADATALADTSFAEEDTILVSETIIRRVASERKAILSKNARRDDRFDGQSIVAAEIRTVIAAPICAPGGGPNKPVLGILYADRRGSRQPFTEDELHLLSAAAEQAGGVVHHIHSTAELEKENRNLLKSISDARPIIGAAPAIETVQAFIRKAAPTAMTVLIRGETGTGKDLVASAIHYQSSRRGKPFVPINCAALPENLLESELFGYEKGAFTGALTRKKGRFEFAHTGTIFLDEIAELSPGCQAKLLRLLEERRFERVGGTQPIEVDVRIVAATNVDLAQAIEAGTFREDLFYRLNVLAVTLPALRERREDIPLLIRHFLNELGIGDDKNIISAAAERELLEYDWPGNVRQLKNVIESAVVLKNGPLIEVADLVLPESSGGRGAAAEAWEPESLESVQRKHILRVLEHTGGNKKRAAEILGIERCTLYSKLKSFDAGPSS